MFGSSVFISTLFYPYALSYKKICWGEKDVINNSDLGKILQWRWLNETACKLHILNSSFWTANWCFLFIIIAIVLVWWWWWNSGSGYKNHIFCSFLFVCNKYMNFANPSHKLQRLTVNKMTLRKLKWKSHFNYIKDTSSSVSTSRWPKRLSGADWWLIFKSLLFVYSECNTFTNSVNYWQQWNNESDRSKTPGASDIELWMLGKLSDYNTH